MKKILLLIAGFFCFFQNVFSQDAPKREFRGAWVASYFGIDWPNRNQTPQQQRAAFIAIAERYQQTGITTMFVQVRSQSDALYPSQIEPWGFYLTPLKVGGNQPAEAWDPMQFMIEECHKRGIEFQAWLNPFRAIGNIANAQYFPPTHVYNQHPDWMLANNAERIMNPGLPQVRERINNVVMEIVNNYDVDGIHFDDYFYPNIAFNDDAAYTADPRGIANRADWRRDNINLLIKSVSENIKTAKPWVEFGVSPSGIWRNGGEGSATSGLQHYVSLYADSRKWLQEGWVDYLCPQVYWYIGQPGSDYKVLIPWWNNNAFGRLIYIGQAGYKVGAAGQGSFTTDRQQIPNQIRLNRSAAYPNIHGQAIYNTTSLVNNNLNFRDSIQQLFYNIPALQPNMPWIDATPPLPAQNLQAVYTDGKVVLTWNNPPETINELDKVKQQVIYRSESADADIEDARNILAITPTAVFSFEDATAEEGKVYYYRVTTVDRLANESTPTQSALVCTSVPQIVECIPAISFCAAGNATYTVPQLQANSNCLSLTYSYEITGATVRSGTGNNASGVFEEGVSTITWTVTDAAGNSSTCQTIITIHANPTVTIADAYALAKGVLPNTVYKGYAPAASLTLSADAAGGSGSYTYNWSSGSTEATETVVPATSQTYLLTVTDENGCQATAIKEVNVMDVRAGKNGNKVKVCHPTSGTLEVETQDVEDHLAHGDMLGSCQLTHNVYANQLTVVQSNIGSLSIKAYPNPTPDYFTIQIQNASSTSGLYLRVLDLTGRSMEQHRIQPQTKTVRIGQALPKGVYLVEISNGTERTILKLIKQ